jgi:hypothetical protein
MEGSKAMRVCISLAFAAVTLLGASVAVQAGSIERGFRDGVSTGNKAAGPVGGAIGGVMGATAYGFRSGASKVLGIPEETGSVRRGKNLRKREDLSR